MSQRPLSGVLEMVAAAACVLGLVWSVMVVDYVPSNDGPQHSFVGYVEAHYGDSGSRFRDDYVLNGAVTSNGYSDLFVLLEPRFGLNMAHQLIILLTLLLWSGSWFFWVRRAAGAGSFLALLAFPCALQWLMWIGLYPFLLASAFIPLVLLIRARWGQRLVAVLATAVLLVFVTRIHVFSTAIVGLVLAAWSLTEVDRWRSLLKTAAVGLPSLFYIWPILSESKMTGSRGTSWEMSGNPLDVFFEFFLPGPAGMQMLFLALVLLATVTAIRAGGRHHVFVAMGLFLLIVGLALPLNWLGWELVRPRLLPTAFLLIIGSAAVPKRLVVPVAVLVLGFAGWRFMWVARLHRNAAEQLAPMIAQGRQLKLEGTQWAYIVTAGPTGNAYRQVKLSSGFLHLAQAVAPYAGGAPYFSHDGDSTIHHILLKRQNPGRWLGPMNLPSDVWSAWSSLGNRRQRDIDISTYLAALSWLDVVAVYGLPGDGETLAEAGYDVEKISEDSSGHALFRGTFVGCSWDLQIDGLVEDTTVAIGFGAERHLQDVFIVGPAGRLRIDDLPCGPAWFTVEARCLEEGSKDGRVFVSHTEGAQTLHCTVPQPAIELPAESGSP